MHTKLDIDARRPDEVGAEQDQVDVEAASRREALARLGRFAYVAPALTLLAEPGLAHAAYGKADNNRGHGR